MNRLKTDYPGNLKIWLMCFFTIIFPIYMQKKNLSWNDVI